MPVLSRFTPLASAPRGRAGLILLLVCGLTAAAAQPGERGEGREEGLGQIENLIVSGFQQGDADRLAAAFSRRVKTYVACAPLAAADGYYGADQMRLLLRRMFRGRETVRFRILEPAARRRPDGLAVLSALWIYKDPAASQTQVRLSFSIGPEAGSWLVREVRDLK